jgi:hypothetical protein
MNGVTEVDDEVMTYGAVRNWHAVAEELKAQVRQLQLDNVLLQEKVTTLEDKALRLSLAVLDSVPGGTGC